MSPVQLHEPVAGRQVPVWKRFIPVFVLVLACWGVFVVNNLLLSGHLGRFGVVPRHLSGLPGILWAPFLHGSYQHLLANSIPLLVLGGILCSRSRAEFGAVTVAGIALSGALIWLFARNAIHIGASGVIFCYFGYLASLAWFRRTLGTLLVSAGCILLYGGMLKGLLPNSRGVSWEGHLAGLVAGIGLAWMGSKLYPRQQPAPLAAAEAPPPVDLAH